MPSISGLSSTVLRAGRAERLARLSLLITLCGGCSEAADARGDSGGEGGRDATEICKAGEIVGATGDCMPVGIQGCAELFLSGEPHPLCRPQSTLCPPGSIPRFDQGCVEVGIPRARCADIFMEEDGLCHPTTAKCADRPGTFAVPSEGCVPIDGPDGCGTGTWGNIPDAPGNVYVDPGAPPGGDGSKQAPLQTIAAALMRVRTGGRVALAAGVYDKGFWITKGIELAGRCPSMVRIQGTTPQDPPSVIGVSRARGVTIRGVQVVGDGFGITALHGAEVAVEQVHIRGALYSGVSAFQPGSSLSLLRSFVEDTRYRDDPLTQGYGAAVAAGGRLVISKSALVGSFNAGLGALDAGSTLMADSTLVQGMDRPEAADAVGAAVQAQGALSLDGCAVINNPGGGILIRDAGTELTVTTSLVAGNIHTTNTQYTALGVSARFGAHASLTGNAIVGNEAAGLRVGQGATMSSTGDLIAHNVPCGIHGPTSPPRLTVERSWAELEIGRPGELARRARRRPRAAQ